MGDGLHKGGATEDQQLPLQELESLGVTSCADKS